ncbi:MAG: hypothetical protein HY814_09290, partial [Candidatus Riflebacteria bacterium]|nr:hypothetical protein [Candidatus Riflebacteria bacterium]
LYDFACVCGIPVGKFLSDRGSRTEYIDQHVFRVVILQFQDRHNWDMKVARKCCLGVALPDRRVVPFDTYNVLHRPGTRPASP